MANTKNYLSIFHTFMEVHGSGYDFVISKKNPLAVKPFSVSLEGSPNSLRCSAAGEGHSIREAKSAAAKQMMDKLMHMPDAENKFSWMWYFRLEMMALPARVTCSYESLASTRTADMDKDSAERRRTVNVCLRVLDMSFIGAGRNRWAARNVAAHLAVVKLAAELVRLSEVNSMSDGMENISIGVDPVCAVYERALKLQQNVEVTDCMDEGSRTFDVTISVGDHQISGSGSTKKLAKRSAAQKMLLVLPDYSHETNKGRSKQRHQFSKPKGQRELDPNMSAVSYLVQLLQMRGEPSPVFLDEGQVAIGEPPEKLFKATVSLMGHMGVGHGKTKKEAKHKAADALLKDLHIRGSEIAIQPEAK